MKKYYTFNSKNSYPRKYYPVNETKYYQSSGKCDPSGLISILLFGSVSSLGLGIVYGYLTFFLPFIYFNVLFAFVYGGLIGYSVGTGGKMGKVRNSKLVIFFGFAFGLFALYVAWVSWIHALSKQEVIAINPLELIDLINKVAENGVWSIKNTTPTGVFLYICWAIEAIIIVVMSGFTTSVAIGTDPFCEICQKWITTKDFISRIEPIGNANELKSQLEKGNFTSLTSLSKIQGKDNGVTTQINLVHCPNCKKKHFLTILSVQMVMDDENKLKKEERAIVENLIITSSQFDTLKSQWKKVLVKKESSE